MQRFTAAYGGVAFLAASARAVRFFNYNLPPKNQPLASIRSFAANRSTLDSSPNVCKNTPDSSRRCRYQSAVQRALLEFCNYTIYPNEPSRSRFRQMHSDPIAFFITWTCYGTWIPGDGRGWTKWQKGDHVPQPLLADWCRERMTDTPVLLNEQQRWIINGVVEEHCQIRTWHLHAVNCRSNHCHVVASAFDYDGEQVRDQFKSWGKRRLKEHQHRIASVEPERELWWTRKGSVRYIFEDESLEAAIKYVLEAQDSGGSKCESL